MSNQQSGRPRRPQFMPDIGFDVPEWVQNWMTEAATILETLAVDPNPPAQPTGVTLTQAYPGIVVRWNKTIGASQYVVYRNTTGNFDTATIVAVLPGQNNVSTLNITQDLASNATIYYWVVAENASGVRGPISALTSTANSTPPVGGTITTETDVIFASTYCDPDELHDAIGLAGSGDFRETGTTVWAYSEGDEDYWQSNDLTEVSVP